MNQGRPMNRLMNHSLLKLYGLQQEGKKIAFILYDSPEEAAVYNPLSTS